MSQDACSQGKQARARLLLDDQQQLRHPDAGAAAAETESTPAATAAAAAAETEPTPTAAAAAAAAGPSQTSWERQ